MTDIAETADIRSLLPLCIAGDQLAIERLVRRFETGVFRLALSIVDDSAEAAEIAQETFLSALRSLPTYEEKSSFKAWLYTIAMNLSRSRLRKRRALHRLRALLTGAFQAGTRITNSPEEVVIQDERDAAVWQALTRLDEKHRLPVILRYFHELSIVEIAQILNVNEGTIHSRLHYARARLQEELKPQFAEELS